VENIAQPIGQANAIGQHAVIAPAHHAGMNDAPTHNLNDLPLWRLLVELHDAERYYGPDSPTARTLARPVRERLADEEPPRPQREVSRAR
jgi:hypothetical protein